MRFRAEMPRLAGDARWFVIGPALPCRYRAVRLVARRRPPVPPRGPLESDLAGGFLLVGCRRCRWELASGPAMPLVSTPPTISKGVRSTTPWRREVSTLYGYWRLYTTLRVSCEGEWEPCAELVDGCWGALGLVCECVDVCRGELFGALGGEDLPSILPSFRRTNLLVDSGARRCRFCEIDLRRP